MTLDVRTLYIVMGVSCFLVSGALLFFQARPFRTDGVREWSTGYACQGVFWVFLGLRGIIPDVLSIVVANTLLTVNYSLLYAAMREFQRRPCRRDLLFLPAIATSIFFLFFWAFMDITFYRTVYITLVSGIQMGFIASILFLEGPFQVRRPQWLTGSFFAVGSILWFVRLLQVLSVPGREVRFLEPSMVLTALLLAGFGVVVLTSVGFLLMIRERAGEELKESEERYRTLVETTRDLIYTTDRKGTITFTNQALEKILGYASHELNGMSFTKILAPEFADKARGIFRRAMKGEVIPVYEAEMIRKDGTRLFLEFNAETLCDETGQPAGRYGIGRDITERKKAEEALQKAYKDIQNTKDLLVQSEKLAALGTLSSGAAHEILNPLNILSLRLQVIGMTENLSDKMKEALKIANVQIDRIVKITRSISEFSRSAVPYRTMVDLKELMKEVFSIASSRLKEENVTIDFQHQDGIPLLSLDRFRIEQVILNLINNAVDAMKDRKDKILRVRAALESPEGKRHVRVSFADNGTGIRAEDMNRIFEPFFTTKEPDKGKGLGLSVCYGIVQDHHGTIRAENNEQGGATFIIELPV